MRCKRRPCCASARAPWPASPRTAPTIVIPSTRPSLPGNPGHGPRWLSHPGPTPCWAQLIRTGGARATVTSGSWPNRAAWGGNVPPDTESAATRETTMGRYEHLIGPKLRIHIRPAQLGEVALAVQVLNRMIRTAKPVSRPPLNQAGQGLGCSHLSLSFRPWWDQQLPPPQTSPSACHPVSNRWDRSLRNLGRDHRRTAAP